MSRRYTTGFWGDAENHWRYISLTQKRVWEKCENFGRQSWRIIAHGEQPTRDLAAVMRHDGWWLLDPRSMDASEYEQVLSEAGEYPEGMILGDGDLIDGDRQKGWRGLDADRPDFYELASADGGASDDDDADVCVAAFLGCEPCEVDDVFAWFYSADTACEAGDVTESVVPAGRAWREVPELVNLGVKPRVFGRLHHRVAYVFAGVGGVTVAWKEGYVRGSDPDGESLLQGYVRRCIGIAA